MSEDDVIWRYISLDKLIHLLETESLFLTPLVNYKETDPFEGLLPKTALEAIASVSEKASESLRQNIDEVAKRKAEQELIHGKNEQADRMLEVLRAQVSKNVEMAGDIYLKVMNGVTVNCWHKNTNESEAMWKLYSDEGKGVAIKTCVKSLSEALEHQEQDVHIRIGKVKYLDFFDESISPKDCVVDGHILSPLLKRSAFQHENEVRLFHTKKADNKKPAKNRPVPLMVKVSLKHLIEHIYISPFVSEPYISSIYAICKKYEIPNERIINSTLLSGHEELMRDVFKKTT